MIFKKKVKRRLSLNPPKKDLSWLDESIKQSKEKGKNYKPTSELDFLYKKSKTKHKPTKQEKEMDYIQKSIWRN